MKPLLSENGSVELGFGLLLLLGGALHHVFPGRDASAFESAVLFGLGIAATAYGYSLRKAWNARIRDDVERLKRQQSDKL